MFELRNDKSEVVKRAIKEFESLTTDEAITLIRECVTYKGEVIDKEVIDNFTADELKELVDNFKQLFLHAKREGKCAEEMEVYSRVVGYYRPTKYWNKGKKEEFGMRKTFDLDKS